MRREFEPFDEKTIRAEFDSLPRKDRAKLAALIEFYEDADIGNPYPAQVDAYEGGVFRLRHVKASYQGRALFYVNESREGAQRLILLTIYKKESASALAAVLDRARRRMADHKRRGL